jgi:hypothetical protein
MVIIADKQGQLANRLFLFRDFIANAIEYQYTLIHNNFDEYIPYFEATASKGFAGYPIRTKICSPKALNDYLQRVIVNPGHPAVRLLRKLNRLEHFNHYVYEVDNAGFDLGDPEFIRKAQTKIMIVRGWPFSDVGSLKKHALLIKKFFTPLSVYCQNIALLLEKIRQEVDIVIGIHIRRGDYARFENGRYFYSFEVYAQKAKELAQQFDGKKVGFLLCSDDTINVAAFDGLRAFPGTGHFIEDLYSLARCDYLIGPPSSFSAWASFYGDVPLQYIRDAQGRISF